MGDDSSESNETMGDDSSESNETMGNGRFGLFAEIDENTSLMRTLVQSIAAGRDGRASELEPLYESVDPEALSDLLSHANRKGGIVAVEFAYEGFSITITEGGHVRIRDGSPQIAQSGGGCG